MKKVLLGLSMLFLLVAGVFISIPLTPTYAQDQNGKMTSTPNAPEQPRHGEHPQQPPSGSGCGNTCGGGAPPVIEATPTPAVYLYTLVRLNIRDSASLDGKIIGHVRANTCVPWGDAGLGQLPDWLYAFGGYIAAKNPDNGAPYVEFRMAGAC